MESKISTAESETTPVMKHPNCKNKSLSRMIVVSVSILSMLRWQAILIGQNSMTAMPQMRRYNFEQKELSINDPTIPWDTTVHRLWMDGRVSERPPAMLLLTTEGWNNKNRTMGLQFCRHKRETDLFTAIVNHPWFHPTAWDDIETHNATILPGVHYYVFLDHLQCPDYNYPLYNGGTANLDTRWNRTGVKSDWIRAGNLRGFLGLGPPGNSRGRHILGKGRLFQETERNKKSSSATAVIFDCAGIGVPPDTRASLSDLPISFASISALISDTAEAADQGLIPPADKPVQLSEWEVKDIATCAAETNRALHVVFVGSDRSGKNKAFKAKHGSARLDYFVHHDNNKTFVLHHKRREFTQSALANLTYEEIMRQTVFGLAPRGDNKFTYRFTELLSAGVIPVVHADHWIWPFRPEIVDWRKCAVILPERDSGKVSLDFLDLISVGQRCQMRQQCYEIYKKYVETPEGTVRGIIEGLVVLASGREERLPMIGVRCNTTHDDPDCNMER